MSLCLIIVIHTPNSPVILEIQENPVCNDYVSFFAVDAGLENILTRLQHRVRYKFYIPWKYFSRRCEKNPDGGNAIDTFIGALLIDPHLDHIRCYHEENDQTTDRLSMIQESCPKIRELFHEDLLSTRLNIDTLLAMISQVDQMKKNGEMHLIDHVLPNIDRIFKDTHSWSEELQSTFNRWKDQHSDKFGQSSS